MSRSLNTFATVFLVSSHVLALPNPNASHLEWTDARNSSATGLNTRQGWTSTPDERGTIDIIWGSIFTMFLCSWSIICVNIPGRGEKKTDNSGKEVDGGESRLRIFNRRFWLTCLCFLGPEFTLQLALGQWVSARRSVKEFEAAGLLIEGKHRWTITHAFYADMGGFMLQTKGDFPAFPIDAKQLLWLLRNGYIKRPDITRRQIKDKDKVDSMLRLLTLCQVFWFLANIVARGLQRLPVTCIEITAAAFILSSSATMYCWAHKPADVNEPTFIDTEETIYTLVWQAHEDILQQKRDHAIKTGNPNVVISTNHLYSRTPLDVLSREEWHWSLYWSHWINILDNMGISFAPAKRPADRFENTISLPLPTSVYLIFTVLTFGYVSIFMIPWNFDFPTPIERTLWRASALSLLASAVAYAIITYFAFELYPTLEAKLRRRIQSRHEQAEEEPQPKENGITRRITRRLNRLANHLRNNSEGKDPELTLPLKAVLSTYIVAVFYCSSRTYILLADFIDLRSQPANVYTAVSWSKFLPHIS